MGINVVIQDELPKCVTQVFLPKERAPKFALEWAQSGYQFVAAFAYKEPIMAIYLVVDGQVVDETEVQYPTSVLAISTQKIWKDLKLKELAECLISQASNSGKIEGESIHTLRA